MSKSFRALGLAVSALALTQLPAAAQTKVTNEGVSANELVVGTHTRTCPARSRSGAFRSPTA